MTGRLLFIFVLLFSITTNSQEILYNQEFQVNTYTDSEQFCQNLTTLPSGKFIICWESWGQNGEDYSTYAQIFNPDGSRNGEEFRISDTPDNFQKNFQFKLLADGKFVAIWKSKTNFHDNWNIFARIFNSDGEKLGDEIKVNSDERYYLEDLGLCPFGNNKFVVFWGGIFAQLFDSSGEKIGEEFQVNTSPNPSSYFTCSTGFGDNRFVICWERDGENDEQTNIYAQIFNEDGNKIGNEFQVNTYVRDAQTQPEVISLTNGKFVISWISNEQDGSYFGVYAQMYDSAGIKIGEEFRINSTTDFSQDNQCIFFLAENKYIICWLDHDASNVFFTDIKAQIFNSEGSRIGEEFQVNTNTDLWLGNQQLTVLSDGKFLFSWHSLEQDGNGWGIYAQLFDSTGNKIGKEFQVNTYTKSNQSSPRISALSDNKFVICWNSQEQDGSKSGIYGKVFLSKPIHHTLTEFEVTQPVYDETLHQTNINFTWLAASQTHINFPWELTYDLYIDNDETFSNPLIITGVQDTTYQIDSLAAGHTYFAKVLARNYYGDSLWSSNNTGFYIHPNATDNEDAEELPSEFKLAQNYPNPFNPETNIQFAIPDNVGSVFVEIKIYNFLGELVKVLLSKNMQAGTHKIKWNGKDSRRNEMPSGIYFYTLMAGNTKITKKMILLQ